MRRSWNKLPPAEPEEDLLVAKCREMGSAISRFDDYDHEFTLTIEIAEMLAHQLEHIKSAHVRHVVLQLIERPEFRERILQPIVEELKRHGKEHHGQQAANALGRIVSPKDAELIAELLLNKDIDDARSLMVPTYAKIAKKSAIPVLRQLVSDPMTRSQSLKHLSILGDTSIEGELLKLAKHEDSYHRAIARDALKRVDKNQKKAASM